MSKNLVIEKIEQAVKILNEKNIDLWLTFTRESGNMKDPMMDMLVGTNCTWESAYIITKNGDSIALLGSLDVANMRTIGTYKEVHGYVKSIKEKLVEILDRYKPGKIAINFSRNSCVADGLSHGMYLELLDHLNGTDYKDRLVSSEELVAALRGRKSPAELELMKTAIHETLKIFDEVTSFIKPGVTEQEIASFILKKCEERNFATSWEKDYCPSVFTGPDTAGAHVGPTDRKVERGHVINIDFGIKLNGYCSDLQRTWYVLREGENVVPAEVQKGFNVIKESIQLSAKELKPGKNGYEIDDIARNYIVQSGYEEYPHALGHQIGRFAHDGGGLLAPKWERYGSIPFMPVEEGQVYTLEPRLPIKDYGIATIEEEVVVTKDGCEFLSKPQQEIFLIK
jgi:Xaa-Pro aminopeptidase